MADISQIRSSVEQAVSKRLTSHVDHLRQEVIEQVVRELEPLLAGTGAGSPIHRAESSSEILRTTISAIQASTAQAEILKALLEGVSKFTPRTALFVVRGTSLVGWQARGFADDNIRGLALDGSRGLAARSIQERNRVAAGASDCDSGFVERNGRPADGSASLFPLVVKDKVAAILYCDAGREPGRSTDYSAVEVLTRYTCLWLELAATKKPGAPSGAEAGVTAQTSNEAGARTSLSSAPAVAAKAAVGAETRLESLSAEEQELHQKAKRFAKLLVDEIKLYNQAKVAEGKQHRELYKALREDIEKSRATYDKRYGGTPVASAKYFDSEVVRILADNDRSLLGNDFPA